MSTITRKTFGPGFMPAYHRPWLRYVETPDEGGAQDPPADAGGDETPSEGEAPAGTDPQPQGDAQGSLEDADRDTLMQTIRDLRRENGAKRTAARDATSQFDEFKQGLAKALGLGSDEKEVTPEQLQTQLQEAKQQADAAAATAKEQAVQLAVLRHAPALNANGTRLLDSRSFLTKISAVDPQNEAAIKEAISTAVKDDSAFATIPTSSGSGTHQGSGATATPKTLAAAVSKHYGA